MAGIAPRHVSRVDAESIRHPGVTRVITEVACLVAALGLLPLALSGGRAGQEIEQPMAVVILGGLCTSTVLNLFVVPAMYLRWGGQSTES